MLKNFKIAGIVAMAAIFFIFDRALKWLFTHIWKRAEFPLVGDWLRLKLSVNSGIAFGLPVNYLLIIFFTILAIMILIYLAHRAYAKNKSWELVAYSLIIVGAFSNLLDRLAMRAVIDYFDVKYFTVFNLADAYITIGLAAVLLCVILIES